MFPKDPAVWIVVAILIAIVVALAIWFGRGFEIGKWYIRVKPAEAKKSTGVSVGEKLKMTGAKVGGDIAGIKKSGGDVSQNIDVLRGGELKDTDIHGDITGFKQEGDGKK
jgi:ABC-type transporter Mla subunit MlaD